VAQPIGWIKVRGARTHNLHNVNLDVPIARLVVITGPSGSGKSSLAFDTLHAEGQRRYLETLANDARALFTQLKRPDVDVIDGLPPTLCVSQHSGSPRPRSTLATITEIHDHCRLLWARLGIPHCYECGTPVYKNSVADIVRQTLQSPDGRKIYILAPLIRDKAGDHKDILAQIRQGGFLRARVDGVLHEIRDSLPLNPKQRHTIEVVIDRLVVRSHLSERLTESLTTALKFGQGLVIITDIDDGDWHDQPYNTVLECPNCQIPLPELEPRLFSFNNPQGACPRCTGYGQVRQGNEDQDMLLDETEEETDEDAPAAAANSINPCPECGGARLNRAARAVAFEGKGLHEVTAMSVGEANGFFSALCLPVGPTEGMERVRAVLLREINQRLGFLQEVGLGYLTLDRPAQSLSGGELQRARLATHLGGGLLGVCYILDEPTIGLHPRDSERLIGALRGLVDRGNTVLVVEHDESVMRAADYLVDIGPGAGRDGGRLLACGTFAEVLANPASVTATFLRQPRPDFFDKSENSAPLSSVLRGEGSRARGSTPASVITIRGARHHNLKNLTVSIPLGNLVAITGVSGSGKSSLARDTLCYAARRHLGQLAPIPRAFDCVEGLEHIDKVIEVDQKRLGRSSRSNPASYTGVFDEIRKVFAATKTAKVRGYKATRFSFNVSGGRCEECQGQGSLRVALQFLPELTAPCPACQGKRFNRATLEVRYRDRTITDVLDMAIGVARDFFANIPAIHRVLDALVDVGLGYLCLGQPSSTLSGGEAQRVKLAAELAKTATGRTLFLLDEPTTGLHFGDVANLIRVLRRLVMAGNTLVVIEHNLDLIRAADWVIDLGPEGGAAGGYLVVAGTPLEMAQCASSITGRFLKSQNMPCYAC
jgi:excinuclease ABC subunit A